jgi:hypothetical protein
MAGRAANLVTENRDVVEFEYRRFDVPLRFRERGRLGTAQSTEISGRLLIPAGPSFVLARMGAMKYLFQRGSSVDAGLPHLAGEFALVSDRPEAARAMISARVARRIRELGDVTVSCNGVEVSVTVPGRLAANLVDEVAEVVVSLGDADIFGLTELRALPHAEYHPPDGTYAQRTAPYVSIDLGARVDFAPIAVHGVAQTWLARAYDHGAPYSCDVSPTGHTLPALPRRLRLEPRLRQMLAATGGGNLAAREHTLRFQWPRVETRRERLLAAGRLLATFPAEHGGNVYR